LDGVVVPADQIAGDVVVVDGTVRIAGHATGDVISMSGPVGSPAALMAS
jgi:hypothetical protein